MIVPERSSARAASGARYSSVAIVLHWIIAAVILFQLFLGWRMNDLAGLARSSILQLHKSIGIAILLLSLARLAWRLVNPPPPEPKTVTPRERWLAGWVHRGFYVIMIGLPLTGWAMISTTRVGPGTMLFGVIPWPRIPLLPLLPRGLQETLSVVFDNAHVALVWLTLALLFLHIAGALKHHLISRDPVLSRMAPGVPPGALLNPQFLAIPIAALVVAAGSYAPKPAPPATPRPKVIQLAAADIYLDVVQPAFDRRCVSCHNDDRSKGGLSLASYVSLMAGGRTGPVIVVGAPAQSELFKRITLPSNHDKYMPQDGRTPLNENQIKAIGWWISIGAPGSAQIARLKLTDAERPVLLQILGLAGAGASDRGEETLVVVNKADARAVRDLENAGFVVRPVSAESNLVDINLYGRKALTDQDVANLGKLKDQIHTLNLRDAGVSDAQLKVVGQMPNLKLLRLEGNPVTDAGIANLGGLKSLRYLNLYGTKVGDASLAVLRRLPNLERVHAWQTGVTEAGRDRAQAANPKLKVTLETKPGSPSDGSALPPAAGEPRS